MSEAANHFLWVGVLTVSFGYTVGTLILDALIVYGDRLMDWSTGKDC